MSYNGSGTFNINTSGQPVVTGTVISSTAFNALTADLGTGLSTAITKDGQTTATARIPFAAGINSSLVTDATSTTTGSIITAGGVGIAKALYVGTTLNVAGASTLAAITGTFNGTVGATTPSTGDFTSVTGTVSSGAVSTYTASGANQSIYSRYIGGSPNVANVYVGTDSAAGGISGIGGGGLLWNVGNGGLAFGANNALAMSLSTTGALALKGASTSATGVGITFPATQSASTEANTLDDYEEGTWTPNQGAGLTVVGTFSSVGSYTKIGRMVYVSGGVKSTSTVAFSAGGVVCSNLPFTAITSPQQPGSGAMSNSTSGPSSLAYSSTVYATASGSGADGYFFNIAYQI